MNLLNRLLHKYLGKWECVDSEYGYWNLKESYEGVHIRKLCFYQILYSRELNEYRLKVSGYRPYQHLLYGEMTKRIAHKTSGYYGSKWSGSDRVLDDDEVVIDRYDLTDDMEKYYAEANKDPLLVEAIQKYKKTLRSNFIEIFEHRLNILVTADGIYIARRGGQTPSV